MPAVDDNQHVTTDTAPLDGALAQAIDLAREAAVIESGVDNAVGDHLEVAMESERLATHLFACTLPGYIGWQWAVTVTRADGFDDVTVCDAVLLAGPASVTAPEWVPWSERVRPGDLGPGDVLPTPAADLRLIAGLTDEDALEGVASLAPLLPGQWELGLGRVRVLSPMGRDEATDRWHDGDFGPDSAMARAATLECVSCGFLLTMGGPVGQSFGVCANGMSPADGRVVSLEYGCGAHSEVERAVEDTAHINAVFDELGWDHLDMTAVEEHPAPVEMHSDAVDMLEESEDAALAEAIALEAENGEVIVAELAEGELETIIEADPDGEPLLAADIDED